MNRRLPPLNSLRAFESSARHLSFTKAAEELNVTPAAISQQVKLLENYFSVKLFKRLTRALKLTAEGQTILPILSEGFDKLAEADTVLRNHQLDNILMVSVAPAFGAKWLLPRLDLFREFAPEYEIRIDATTITVDFNRENVDVALRYGSGDYPGLVSECLITERIVPVCSPALLQGRYPIKTPADLQHHTLLQSMPVNDQESFTNWHSWLKAAGIHDVPAADGPRFNLSSMLVQAAIEGQGVALVDYHLAAKDIQKGLLMQLFTDDIEQISRFSYYLVYPEHHLEYPKVKVFRQWILNQIKKQKS